jgi:N-acetylmuramoyl-L-alanine amidase
MVKIFIDPGHGGSDPGASGNGLQEKNITLSITTRIRDILLNEYQNVSVKMSRTSDETVSLQQRTDMANSWGADFYLSVHINSGGGTGYEDYIHSPLSDSSRTANLRQIIHAEVIKLNNLTDRGMKKADYHVLRESTMDAVLTENGFIDTASDAAKMKDSGWLDNVARGHVNGLAKAFSLSKKAGVTQVEAASTTTPSSASTTNSSGKHTIYLPPTVDEWRIYPLDKAPVKANALPYRLHPKKFGGLTYDILGEPQPNVYIIETRDFGKVQIYGGPDTDAVVK